MSSNSWQQSRSYCNSFITAVIKSNDSVAHNKRFICSNLTARVEIKYFRLIDNKNLFRFVWIKTVTPTSFCCLVTLWTGFSAKSTSGKISFRSVTSRKYFKSKSIICSWSQQPPCLLPPSWWIPAPSRAATWSNTPITLISSASFWWVPLHH